MNLTYTSSNGSTFNLKVEPIRTRSANFHDFQWRPRTVTLQYGDKVTRFDKSSVVYEALLDISGSIGDRKEALNDLHRAFEYDIANMKPGRITHGRWYIECYIIVSKTFYKHPYTQNQISIYCPYPMWMKKTSTIWTMPSPPQSGDLGYDYGYYHDYTPVYDTRTVTVESPFPANLEISFYVNIAQIFQHQVPGVPWVLFVDGVEKINFDDLYLGRDYYVIEISTRNKTVVTRKSSDNSIVNLFNRRLKTPNFFAPLSAGTHTISVPYYSFTTVDVFEERSEPLWT